ncbi:hypothetical protein T02_12370 [Trichinella nativa]|uniref:Uncharacterized protein n=1 Tax=Trichinella nativa TaxID=6335 RepID=A0A0V1L5N1_9BILA|nr:hypothetical protein T02_12370 [Trichinella nativa]
MQYTGSIQCCCLTKFYLLGIIQKKSFSFLKINFSNAELRRIIKSTAKPRMKIILRTRCLLNWYFVDEKNIIITIIKSRENFCLLNVVNCSHSSTCLPENVCKFLFHCYPYVYVALLSMIAGLLHLRFYEREYKNYKKGSKAFVLHGSEYTLNV